MDCELTTVTRASENIMNIASCFQTILSKIKVEGHLLIFASFWAIVVHLEGGMDKTG